MPIRRLKLIATALALAAGAAFAQTLPAPSGVINLQASAQLEVPKDTLRVTFTATRDGKDAQEVQSLLKQALDAALAEARKAARPVQVEVQTGNFSLYPRYNKAAIVGWQGTAELVVEGRDMPAIGQLSGRIGTMTVGRVVQTLSREQRERVEGDVAAQAIARFRVKAAEYAKQFGYAGYGVREVNVHGNEASLVEPVQLRQKAMTASASSDESLPVEAGKAVVSVMVNGSVQLK